MITDKYTVVRTVIDTDLYHLEFRHLITTLFIDFIIP